MNFWASISVLIVLGCAVFAVGQAPPPDDDDFEFEGSGLSVDPFDKSLSPSSTSQSRPALTTVTTTTRTTTTTTTNASTTTTRRPDYFQVDYNNNFSWKDTLSTTIGDDIEDESSGSGYGMGVDDEHTGDSWDDDDDDDDYDDVYHNYDVYDGEGDAYYEEEEYDDEDEDYDYESSEGGQVVGAAQPTAAQPPQSPQPAAPQPTPPAGTHVHGQPDQSSAVEPHHRDTDDDIDDIIDNADYGLAEDAVDDFNDLRNDISIARDGGGGEHELSSNAIDGGTALRQPDGFDGMGAKAVERNTSFFAQPGILAAVVGGAVVGLLCAILLVMLIVYRMRKKDEGSYPLDEPKRSLTGNGYSKNYNKEFYA